MTRYVIVRLTAAQAAAANNACDLIADSLRADGDVREAGLYQRTSAAIELAFDPNRLSRNKP